MKINTAIINYLDEVRSQENLMTINDVIKLSKYGNVIYDPFTVLISKSVKIGYGNIFFPNTLFLCSKNNDTDTKNYIEIGDRNIFHMNTRIEATNGSIVIGSDNEFSGGFTAQVNRRDYLIEIDNYGRYINGVTLYGNCNLGTGSQILGQIIVQDCQLRSGVSWRDPDIKNRGGVLKGFGTAQNITVEKGHVIVGQGIFNQADIQEQIIFHPLN